jgi:nucleotide-binding universal stress UspA family protein
MKIIIPVDETDRYKSVLKFVSRLEFPEVTIMFLHAVAPVSCYDNSFMAVSALSEIGGTDVSALESEAATAHLDTACLDAKLYGFEATSKVGFSFPDDYIEREAAEFEANLIAVAASQKSPLERLFAGSVSLWIAEHYDGDLLLVRDESQSQGTCSVTYATDNSEESLIGLKRMLSWKMNGIAHVEILNATTSVAAGLKVQRFAGRKVQSRAGRIMQSWVFV